GRFSGEEGKTVFNTFACSPNLKDWTLWDGEPLMTSSLPLDKFQAHKPWFIKVKGVTYQFYSANGNEGFGIAVATSKKI
ncbi:MAG TPA: hypothetical protein VK963_04290, partial [Candidatus Saccharimonadales bacterium]|nr:hypothetical protein [Candidatus Saccharimonadales bacterium]